VTSVDEPSRRPDELVRDRQLVVVSNRQPYRHDYADDGDGFVVDRPTGGLTAGLDPVMQRTGGTWIAWGEGDGDPAVADSNGCVSVPPTGPSYVLKHVWLSAEQVEGYYYGYSNQVLWPVCHAALTNVNCEPSFWRRYRRVNERFADTVVDHADDRPLVWFHDYHLALAPRMAGRRLPDDAVIQHFWHVPWPGWDTFRACPHGVELLDGLLGNDVLGFHLPRYRTNFLRCVDAAFDDAAVD
jgi:trehalose 6-phosphate synthase